LAQLPFEVLEEADDNLVITRRIRLPWPLPPVARDVAPRVLFAWASPKTVKMVPHKEHRKLLDAFLGDWPQDALDVLEHASLETLRERIRTRKGGYTHIVVLAHGMSAPETTAPFDLDAKPTPRTFLGLEDHNHETCYCS
ncbi:MAG: hypothetical protein AAFX85_12625, partial [Pseudomonadota bacterium]